MLSRHKILIVDDNLETLESLKHMTQGIMPGGVATANSVKEATVLLNKDGGGVGIVICDWNMPEESGLELLRTLRAAGNNVPFILVTARNDVASVLEARKLGVDLYIAKPFSSEELKRKIRWVQKKGGSAA